MQRRSLALVVLLVLLTLAGCAHSAGRISTTAVDDTSLAREASVSIGADSRYSPAEHQTLRSAVENGSTLANETSDPLDPGLPVAHENRYYDLEHEAVGNTTGLRVEVAVDYNASDPSGDRIGYDDLPAVDRLTLQDMLADRLDDPRLLEPGTDRYRSVAYTAAEADRSVLVDSSQYDAVVYDGEVFPIEVRNRESVVLTTYRYTATGVADDPSVYGSRLREEYGFALSNLSEAERSVMEKAANDSFYPGSPAHEGFDELVDRFLAHDAVTKDPEYRSGSWVARYDGRLYWVTLDYGSFVETAEATETDRERTPSPTESVVEVTPIETRDTDEGTTTG